MKIELSGKPPSSPAPRLALATPLRKAWRGLAKRAATVEEVANLVVYTASAQASATTGAALRVDGGVVETIA